MNKKFNFATKQLRIEPPTHFKSQHCSFLHYVRANNFPRNERSTHLDHIDVEGKIQIPGEYLGLKLKELFHFSQIKDVDKICFEERKSQALWNAVFDLAGSRVHKAV